MCCPVCCVLNQSYTNTAPQMISLANSITQSHVKKGSDFMDSEISCMDLIVTNSNAVYQDVLPML